MKLSVRDNRDGFLRSVSCRVSNLVSELSPNPETPQREKTARCEGFDLVAVLGGHSNRLEDCGNLARDRAAARRPARQHRASTAAMLERTSATIWLRAASRMPQGLPHGRPGCRPDFSRHSECRACNSAASSIPCGSRFPCWPRPDLQGRYCRGLALQPDAVPVEQKRTSSSLVLGGVKLKSWPSRFGGSAQSARSFLGARKNLANIFLCGRQDDAKLGSPNRCCFGMPVAFIRSWRRSRLR